MPSLLEALERKYCSDCEFEKVNNDSTTKSGAAAAAAAPAVVADTDNLISIFIPRLPPLMSVPELLVLNDCDIDRAGDFETIKDKCQRVRELDLAQNKLQDWQEVFHILKHMPRIEFLNLSKNQLMGPIFKPHTPSFENLKGVVLNGTYLDWLCIDVLLENLPSLEELHLSLNDYKEVLIDAAECEENNEDNNVDNDDDADADRHNYSDSESHSANDDCSCDSTSTAQSTNSVKKVSPHRSLKTLHFTGNLVEHWHEVCRLGRVFPALENLVLADCPIKSIYVDAGSATGATAATEGATEATTEVATEAETEAEVPLTPTAAAEADVATYKNFLNLVFLNLSAASINTWDDIDRLALFPKLQNLRVKNWPLWERLEITEHERRQLLIARLPNVRLLNGGGVITADEREDAERAFIRYYQDKPEAERPLRYEELVHKHGHLDPLVNINLKPDKRVKVVLVFKETSQERLVDVYRTVGDLKIRLEKVIGLPANKMRLYYLDKDYREWGPEEMKYPNKQLYSYNIQAGDEIIIDEKK